ncbi:MAG TPA: DmsC/YnfH family molybdoenzyme membrane anchor subunit [Ramlibacter sp.]
MNTRHFQRLQPHWDWRAAANFVCGGAGAGLVFVAGACVPGRPEAPWLLALGLGLVALGLFAVWLELGRPLRAANVLLHLKRSWMSREALVAVLLFGLGTATLLQLPWAALPAALAALAFLYCQGRILRGAKAIPAWREPLTLPLLAATGLAEGVGLFWLLGAWSGPPAWLAVPLAGLPLLRWILWRGWRRRLQASPAAQPALRALENEGQWLQSFGTAVPVMLALAGGSGLAPAAMGAALLATAGALVALTGGAFKFGLITRAGYHHGIVLPRMPVRGVPRTAA